MAESKDSANKKDYICVVGGINLDIFGRAEKRFIFKDSNPGEVDFSVGGVGRNISRALSSLGINVEFITLFGDDYYVGALEKDCKEKMISIKHSAKLKDRNSSYYLCLEDKDGEVCAAVSDMKIFDEMDSDFIEERLDILNSAKLCVLDTNLPKETLKFIAYNVNVPLFVDAVSVKKSDKIRSIMGKINTLKLNRLEAENLSGIEITDSESVSKAANEILKMGVGQVFITMGSKGVHYKNLLTESTLYAKEVQVKNVTGAGDTFFAGAIWANLHGYDINKMAYYGQAAAVVALKSEHAGADDLTEASILNENEEDIIHRGKVL